jgi:serine protease Do
MKKGFVILGSLMLCASLALTGVPGRGAAPAAVKKAPKAKKQARVMKEGLLADYNRSLIAVTKKCVPMVVNISAEKPARKAQVHDYDMHGTPLNRFPYRPPAEPRAMGSGVIVDKKGYIMTNLHVVRDAKAIKVTLWDRREFGCSILGSDPATDIAVIKIDKAVPADLPVIQMADSDKLEVGELVIAIGNPFGFSHTVTTGIVSATGRQSVGLADYENFIQTDAAINPGNSGGALINIEGELVGINTAIFSRSGGNMGIGFAIPSNMVREVMGELIAKGKVTRGWLGVYIQEVTRDIAELFKYEETGGALVSDIIKGSPAEKSAVRKGDIIVSIDGVEIKDVNHLRRVTSLKKPGVTAKLAVFREGKMLEIPMEIGLMPDKPPVMAALPMQREDPLGVSVKDIDEEVAYRYKLADRMGVAVTQVRPESPAERAGLMPGDVIKEVERSTVDSVKAYGELVGDLKGKRKVLLLIARGGSHRFMVVEMEARE